MADRHKPDILILVENLSVPFDRRVWMEAATLQRNGYQVNVVCPQTEVDPERFEVIDGVRIHRFPLPFEGRGALSMLAEYAWALTWMSFLTAKLSITTKIAAVHICNPPDILFIPALLAKLIRRSRIIFDQHDLCPEVWEAKGQDESGLLGNALKLAEAATYKAADHVISTNTSYRDVAMGRGGIAEESVTVVRSAPLKSFALEATSPVRPAEQARRLMYLGTMGSQEGIDLLLEAVLILKTSMGMPDIRLDLAGSGPERPALESMAKDLALDENVKFWGRVSDAQLQDLMAEADLAVNPDRPSRLNSLSSMNKIVEYMAYGLPMVQFDCIEGKRTALEASSYVEEPTAAALAEAIEALLLDAEARQHMRTFGHTRFLEDLCWETQEPSLLSAYAAV
jgi:glycosyltransferase involved in cell wall biosynthesis